jgi:hypothetical protein
MKGNSFEYLLPEYARTLIYGAATKQKHPLKKTVEKEIEKRLNLALDRQTYRVTQSKAAETFVGTIPNRDWPDAETAVYGLMFGISEEITKKMSKNDLEKTVDMFEFLVGWMDIDNVMVAKKYHDLLTELFAQINRTDQGTDARKRAEVRFQYAAESYGRWLEKVMY